MSGGVQQWVTLYRDGIGLDTLSDKVNNDISTFTDRKVKSVSLTSVPGIEPVICVLWNRREDEDD